MPLMVGMVDRPDLRAGVDTRMVITASPQESGVVALYIFGRRRQLISSPSSGATTPKGGVVDSHMLGIRQPTKTLGHLTAALL